MSKLPAFQFYPGDWMKDPDLRRCSCFARGLLMDLLCLCFESAARGVLCNQDGSPWSDDDIQRAAGVIESDVFRSALAELEAKNVLSRDDNGCLVSRRMMRDEQLRQIRAECGSKGGSKTSSKTSSKWQANGKQSGKQKGPPSSSSSPSGIKEANASLSPEATGGEEAPKPSAGKPKPDKLQELIGRWNQIDGVQHVRQPTQKRQKALATRMRESQWRESVPEALARIAKSAFCRGGGEQGWLADIDWFLRPDTVTRILEGKYDDRDGIAADQPPPEGLY